jgi:hypothetical protein
MRALLLVTAACEGPTGLGLAAAPVLVVPLLLGAEPSGLGLVASRVAGIALIGLGLACWPGREALANRAPLRAMSVYNVLATLYLVHLGIAGEWVGRLLWPAAVAHGVFSVWCLVIARRPVEPGPAEVAP